MPVLLMRLAGPLQSWGSASRFTRRETETMPTKSGVIGMIAAALGMGRDESLARFQGLRFGVRVDQPGSVLSDFQTARDDSGKSMPLSRRYYLQDAVFLAGIEDESGSDRLIDYRRALQKPYYSLFLGRRSCPPDGPLVTTIVDDSLECALRDAPWQATEHYRQWLSRNTQRYPELCRGDIMVETMNDKGTEGFVEAFNDEPVSFDPRWRRWSSRTWRRLDAPVEFIDVSGSDTGDGPGSGRAPDDMDMIHDDAIFQTVRDARGKA